MDLSSYTWFHEVPGVPEPDPVSFGRSLLDVEQLIRSLRAPAGSPPVVLVGAGQGASIALAMNAVIPEALAAVVAIGGRPVALPDGAVPDPSESEQAPSLWLAGQGEQERAEAAGTLSDSASMGTPSVVPMPEGKVFGDAVRDEVKGWIGRSVQHAGANSA
jgi:pimeloyl-ACP methyl ester carboxylesterase